MTDAQPIAQKTAPAFRSSGSHDCHSHSVHTDHH